MRLKLNKTMLSAAILLAMLTSLGGGIVVQNRFEQAVEYVKSLNLKSNRANGIAIYGRSKTLMVQQAVSRVDVIKYLNALNYVENSSPSLPGSYRLLSANELDVFPRLSEYKSAHLAFSGNRLAAIQVLANNGDQAGDKDAMRELALEPELLGVMLASDAQSEFAAPPLARCNPVEWEEIKDSHWYYAVIAREDEQFRQHHGISYRAIARAILGVLTRRNLGGGSTLTQQVIKVVTQNNEHTFSRKLSEFFNAVALEQMLSKEEIFTLYSNIIFLGSRHGSLIYGVGGAAELYFGKKDLRQLTVGEATMLAGLINQPNSYLRAIEKGDYQPLKKRQALGLDTMNEQWPDKYPTELLGRVKADSTRFLDRPTQEKSSTDNLSEAYLQHYVMKQAPLADLLRNYQANPLQQITLWTTIDPDLMRVSERLVATHLPELERQFPAADRNIGKGNRMLAALVLLNAQTGEVLVMYGGAAGPDGHQYGATALNASSRLASLWKPFLQALAFDRGVTLPDGTLLVPNSVVDAAAASINGWQPRIGVGAPATLRGMMATSRDDYPVFLLSEVGMQSAVGLFANISGKMVEEPNYEVSLGLHPQMGLSPLKVASAYTAFARNGSMIEPVSYSRVTLNGQAVAIPDSQTRVLFGAEAANMTAEMMQAVAGAGEAGHFGTLRWAFARAGLPVEQLKLSAKTGSGPDAVWAVAVNRQFVAVAWVGYQHPPAPASQTRAAWHKYQQQQAGFRASRTAGVLLADFLISALKQKPELLESR